MKEKISLNGKYAPLRKLRTRYAVITGGRGSGKSFAVAVVILFITFFTKKKTILFTRYTLILSSQDPAPLSPKRNDIINNVTGTQFYSGHQDINGINTAALKSIQFDTWVNDESEELVDEFTFDTIDLSFIDIDELPRMACSRSSRH